jgi:predicted TIM-barrel fold metal-dependent hydrolase
MAQLLSSTPAAASEPAKIISNSAHKSTFNRIPKGSWDSHMHVIGDLTQYPTSKSAAYTPAPHSAIHAVSFQRSVGVEKMVLVQPSIYEDDNSCLLDTLRSLGTDRCRGIVFFDVDKIDFAELESWDKLGVRGIRINLMSVGRVISDHDFTEELQRYADAIRPFNWVLQLYMPMDRLPLLERIAETLDVITCLDHFGCPAMDTWRQSGKPADPSFLEGWASLVKLVSSGRTYVKISAPYRLANGAEDMAMLEAIFRGLCKEGVGKHRLVWASDWPHTRFEGTDIAPFMNQLQEWCGEDEELKNLLFRDNAAEMLR